MRVLPIKLIDPSIEKLPFELDSGAGERARIGLLVLESDQSLEWEMRESCKFRRCCGLSFSS